MDSAELRVKLASHEDNYVERKPEGVRESDIRKTIVAFANSLPVDREGFLLIGIADNGEIVGCINPDDKQKR